ncbi:MAG: UDP-N-acetylglucosamine--N-acetylmuramyl-(pentapeptide) pyrophosphoryl-undecaprenol N-acetylglucosamine transferase, partial [Mycobacteriales bacterium]
MQTVLLAAGGTAGHVEPALATADALAADGFRPVVLGTALGLEARLVPARGYDLVTGPRVPLPRRPGRDLAAVPFRLGRSVRAALAVIDRESPSAVVGFGGYVCVPAYLAARRRRVPIVVHEANARAGIANRLGAKLTPFVAVAHSGCGLPHAQLVGIPLRSEIAHLDRQARRPAARAAFGLPDGPLLLVTGGSQGAGSINRAVVAAAPALAAAGVSVLHHAGAAQAEQVAAAVAAFPRHLVLPYIERMADAYAAADLALCRAGAMTCAELAAVGLPAAYVPLPIGNGEQRLNAEPIVAAGGGLLVDDADLDGQWVARTLLPLLADPARLSLMGGVVR